MPSNLPPFGCVSIWLPVTTGGACGSLPSRRSHRLAAASTETLAPIAFAQAISRRRASRSSSVRQARLTPSPAMAPSFAIAISRSHCRCSLTIRASSPGGHCRTSGVTREASRWLPGRFRCWGRPWPWPRHRPARDAAPAGPWRPSADPSSAPGRGRPAGVPAPRPGQSANTRPPATAPPTHERDCAGAMVGALGAVHPRGAAELGHRQHGGLLPGIAQAFLQRRQPGVELLQHALQPWHLRDVRVPAADLQRGDRVDHPVPAATRRRRVPGQGRRSDPVSAASPLITRGGEAALAQTLGDRGSGQVI